MFTSLCRIPVYEADFGWGKLIWVGSASLPFKNLVVFMDSGGNNGGIETWINLVGEDMAKFQGDQEFLSFVSPTLNSEGFSSIYSRRTCLSSISYV